jgi:uncharacterized protein YbbK (DUF523 family)
MEPETRAGETAEARPVVVVSQCLGFAPVRYDGLVLEDQFVRALGNHVQIVQVCPEVGIGLGVPRDPIRILQQRGQRRLLQPSTGRDLTAAMREFAESFLDRAGPVDGFILKSRSPSCGIKDVKIFDAVADAPAMGKDAGFFAAAVLRRWPHAAIEDERRLANPRLRRHFLVRLFAAARLRAVRGQGKLAYLAPQRLFEPYPAGLMELADSADPPA